LGGLSVMARQPFLPVFAKANYCLGPHELALRPEFCGAIGKCIGIWTYVDVEMADLFSLLLDTQSEAALEVFLTLRRSTSQREALAVAAKHALPIGKVMTAFEAMMVVYRSLEAQRNDLAHGCFGIVTDNPELLLWIDVKHHVHFQTDVMLKQKLGTPDEERHTRLKANLFVYTMPDLDALYASMSEFWWAAYWLNGWLREPDVPERLAEFQKLCASPQIQREISRLNAAPKSKPQSPK
jgi:hypothetical protein